MPYQEYSAKDFAADPYFIKWVKNADAQTDLFWQQWLVEYPEKKSVIEEARQMVLSFYFKTDPDTANRVHTIWQK
jgi:hypothetical protein